MSVKYLLRLICCLVSAFSHLFFVLPGAKENLRDYSGHLACHYLNIKEAEGPDEDCELREWMILLVLLLKLFDDLPCCGFVFCLISLFGISSFENRINTLQAHPHKCAWGEKDIGEYVRYSQSYVFLFRHWWSSKTEQYKQCSAWELNPPSTRCYFANCVI